jgi:transposase
MFTGKRIKRGLYKTSVGQLINSDVNGAYNILRKAIPNAFSTLDRELRSWAKAG